MDNTWVIGRLSSNMHSKKIHKGMVRQKLVDVPVADHKNDMGQERNGCWQRKENHYNSNNNYYVDQLSELV
jgi:hypothetical protein